MHFFSKKTHVLHWRRVRFRPSSGLLVSEGKKLLSSQEEDMSPDQDLTAAERLEALAELLARGIDRLAMGKLPRGKARPVQEKRQVARSHGGIG
jgi:hypothetical protein